MVVQLINVTVNLFFFENLKGTRKKYIFVIKSWLERGLWVGNMRYSLFIYFYN